MTCKKKLKLRKYVAGGRLPKLTTGGEVPYLEQTTDMFAPQQNYGIKGTNQMSTVDYNTGQVKVTGNDTTKSLGSYMGYAGAAGSAIGALSDGNVTGAETQNVVDQVGSNFAFYSLGKTVDEAIFQKDEQGLYKNDLQASLSYGLTDPAQQLNQSVNDFNEGEYGQALFESLLPGLAGIEYQSDQEKSVAAEEKRQHAIKMNAINENTLNKLNTNTINYLPVARLGGKLRRYANGGSLQEPLSPIVPKLPQIDYTYSITPALEYNIIPQTLTSEQSRLIAKEKGYTDEQLKTDYTGIINKLALENPEMFKIGKESTGNTTLVSLTKDPRVQPRFTTINKKIPISNSDTLNTGLDDMNLQLKETGGSLSQDKRLVKRPVIRRYTGQTHEGADGGIPVDSNGNPSIMTGNNPVGLTEKNEVAWNGYVFSDYLKRSKKK